MCISFQQKTPELEYLNWHNSALTQHDHLHYEETDFVKSTSHFFFFKLSMDWEIGLFASENSFCVTLVNPSVKVLEVVEVLLSIEDLKALKFSRTQEEFKKKEQEKIRLL